MRKISDLFIVTLGMAASAVMAETVMAPDWPVSEEEIRFYVGASEIQACLGTTVPEGYVITRYQSTSACSFFPGVPGVQMTFTRTDGLDEISACSSSPYPSAGVEKGYVVVENRLTDECKINDRTPGLTHVYRSVRSLEEENPYLDTFYVCSNSRHPEGYVVTLRHAETYPGTEVFPCHVGYIDGTHQVTYQMISENSDVVYACADGPQPPDNYVLTGVDVNIFSCGYGMHEQSAGSMMIPRYEYTKIAGQAVLRVCTGALDRPAPAGYILTGIEESEGCVIERYDAGEGLFNVPGYAQVYTLPIYTILP